MKSIFVSLSFRDFFSLFRRREKWWNTIIFSLPCYTETFDCDCKIISPLFTIVVARSFGFRSATTTDSSLYLTFISSNSIYEQTCFYCLWNDCNYNFVALFFLCFFGSFSIHALFVRFACRKSFASSDCFAIFRISLSVAVSFREKSELSWAPGWCAQVGYNHLRLFILRWFTDSYLGTFNSRYCKRARFCLFHSTCSSRRCKMQLNLSLIVFCESFSAAVSFCEWILFVITSKQQPTCLHLIIFYIVPDFASCVRAIPNVFFLCFSSARSRLCRLFCSLVKNPLIADTSTMTFQPFLSRSPCTPLLLLFLSFAEIFTANCVSSWLCLIMNSHNFNSIPFSGARASDFLYSNEYKQLHDDRFYKSKITYFFPSLPCCKQDPGECEMRREQNSRNIPIFGLICMFIINLARRILE